MINFYRFFFRAYPNRMLSQSLVVGVLATLGLLSGLNLDLSSHSSGLVFSSAAYAQPVNNDEVTNYARAVLRMEPVRQEAYDDIKKIVSGEVPPIVCYKPESLNALPGNARTVAAKYCNRSRQIVESNGLTIARFNTITANVQSDPNLKRRLHNELIRLQNATSQSQ